MQDSIYLTSRAWSMSSIPTAVTYNDAFRKTTLHTVTKHSTPESKSLLVITWNLGSDS